MADTKVLMFGPKFFGYRETIADEIRAMGWQVDLYDERPNNGVVCKVMLRYDVRLYRPAVQAYYRRVIAENRDKDYDYVLVIKSEAIDEVVFRSLREAYPRAKFILYLWDSVDNVPDGESKIRLYDRVLTFDPVDAERYGLLFRPLFFRREYAGPEAQKADYRYAVAFVGTAHTVRPRIVKQLEEQCRRRGQESFHYLFLPHPLVYWYNKLCNPAYRGVRRADIRFSPISAEEIRAIYADSRCILDVEHEAQRGLTMRTIEMIGSGKKLITTNRSIETYDFYDPHNICIIDKDEPVVSDDFWQCAYEPVDEAVLRRYSLSAFVREILDIKE